MFVARSPHKPTNPDTGTVTKSRNPLLILTIVDNSRDRPSEEIPGAWGGTPSDPKEPDLNLTATLVVPSGSTNDNPNCDLKKIPGKPYPQRKRTTTHSSDYIYSFRKTHKQLPNTSKSIISQLINNDMNTPGAHRRLAETTTPPAKELPPARSLFSDFHRINATKPPHENVAAEAFEMLASIRPGIDRTSIGSQLQELDNRDFDSRRSSNVHNPTAHKHPFSSQAKRKYNNRKTTNTIHEIDNIHQTQKGQGEILVVLSEQIKVLTSLVNESMNIGGRTPTNITKSDPNRPTLRQDTVPIHSMSGQPVRNNTGNGDPNNIQRHTNNPEHSVSRNHTNSELGLHNTMPENRIHHISDRINLSNEPRDLLYPPQYVAHNLGSPPPNQSQVHSYRRSPLSEWKIAFDGSNSSNISEFLSKVETIAESQRITLQHICDNFFLLLKGRAEDWYFRYRKENSNRSQTVTWLNLRSAIKRQFQHHRTSCEVLKAILERRQGESEPFEDFYHAIVTLRSQSEDYISDEKLVQMITPNIRYETYVLINPSQINNLEDLYLKARQAESYLNSRYPTTVRTTRQVHEIETSLYENDAYDQQLADVDEILPPRPDYSKLQCWNCDTTGHSHIYCPVFPRTKYCFLCGTKNVTTPECTNTHHLNYRTGGQRNYSGRPKTTYQPPQ